MNKKVAIIGSGDLGQHIGHYLLADKYAAHIVFYDDYAPKGEQKGVGVVMGKVADAASDFAANVYDEMFLGIGYNHFAVRQRLFEELSQSITFGKFAHSSCFIDHTVRLGAGTVILPGCTFDRGASTGVNVFLNTGCTVAHDSHIGDHSFFGPAVTLAGFCQIGKRCFIGTGSVLIDHIAIADDAQTGGGCVITKNITEAGLYVGVPARKIK
jgi:sugar O-acyltransferase (sialic acid O-acetyltransferase NeuD family)